MVRVPWVVLVPQPQNKAIQKLPQNDAQAIVQAIALLEQDPYTSGNIRALFINNTYRLRVRSYRVKFRILKEYRVVIIEAVVRRTTTTYKKK